MLTITISDKELFDEKTNTFLYPKGTTLVLEHSLVSLSKWESVWKKPFLTKENKTREETIDYIRAMTITQNVSGTVYDLITQEIIDQVTEYIGDTMTATTFRDEKGSRSGEIVTAELIYYWMIAFQIPFECQKWHLNKLLTLIKVCNLKNMPKKKMKKGELLSRNKALNDARRAKLNTTG